MHGTRKERGEAKPTKDEDPDEGLIIKEIRSRIREEKEAAGGGTQEQPHSQLGESMDSKFPITYDKVSDLVRFISTLKKIGPFTVIKDLLETIICWRIFISDTFCLKDAFK